MTHDHLANGGNVKLSQAEIEYERRTPLSERLGIAADSADDREARWSDQAKALEDRVASLEAAAETSRAEHAAAMAEAEGQLFDVRAERDDAKEALSGADNRRESEVYEATAALGLATARIRELEGEREELLGLLKQWDIDGPDGDVTYVLIRDTRAIVARIEKATKGTT